MVVIVVLVAELNIDAKNNAYCSFATIMKLL